MEKAKKRRNRTKSSKNKNAVVDGIMNTSLLNDGQARIKQFYNTCKILENLLYTTLLLHLVKAAINNIKKFTTQYNGSEII